MIFFVIEIALVTKLEVLCVCVCFNWISPGPGWKIAQTVNTNYSGLYGTSMSNPGNCYSSSGLAMKKCDLDMYNLPGDAGKILKAILNSSKP